jgi:hypothetical protein
MEEADGNPSQGQSCYEKTMNATALPWSTVASCVEDEYDLVQTAAMDATPKHQCENLGDVMSCVFHIFAHKSVCLLLSNCPSLRRSLGAR